MKQMDDYNIEGSVPLEAAEALHNLFDSTHVEKGETADKGLRSALHALSKHVGFELKMHDMNEGNIDHILKNISVLSDFNYQKVFLRESAWWNKDNGPFLVIEKSTGNYDCLVPMPGGGYKSAINPSIKIDNQTSTRYESFAYSFFLPLPDRAVGLIDIIRLSFNPCRIELSSIIATQLILGLMGTLTPVLFGLIVDHAIPLSDRSMLGQIVFALFGASICGMILTILQAIAFLRVNLKSTNFVQAALWERLVRLPLSFYRKFGIGELIDRIKGIDRVYQEINNNLIKTFLSFVWSLVTLAILFYYSSTVAWIALTIIFILTLLGIVSSFLQVRYQQKMYFIEGRSSNLLLQILNGIKKIRTMHLEKTFFIRWIDLLTQRLQYFMKARWLSIQFGCIQGLMMTIITVFIYYYYASNNSTYTLGSYITVNALMGNFISSFMTFTSSLMNYLFIIPLYERIKPVLECVPEERQKQKIVPSAIKDIEFKNVSFYYEGSNLKTIDNVSLKIHEKKFIAIVGPSGSGKSTLLRLLLGLEHLQEGKVFVNGIDLKYISLRDLRAHFGVVLQTANLMTGTLFDNISASDPNMREEDIWKAIKLANLEDEVKALPMGLQTVIMDHGAGFSVGQRQRFLIARALCHNPKFLLLDEATSALDNLNQQTIHDNLRSLHITQLVVAHRLSTIEKADYIYVMEKGRIAEEGTYKELMSSKGYFFKMASLQNS
ncbi:MAG: ATP-binding cassette domain-containing protein [Alphaproteobacteria bacterium]|nr:ATP-binding cassette domain-containing protein [Alphaproteobacteria bacterium]